MNNVSVLVNEPVFETPELPTDKRRELHRYLAGVNRQVHRGSMRRKIKGPRWFGILASYVLNDWMIEKFFHQSVFFHKLIDAFRYRLAVSKNPKYLPAKDK